MARGGGKNQADMEETDWEWLPSVESHDSRSPWLASNLEGGPTTDVDAAPARKSKCGYPDSLQIALSEKSFWSYNFAK